MPRKVLLGVGLSIILLLGVSHAAFATSGECSYHGGVDCSAGPNFEGYAVCNDGWVSSVLYSDTEECQQQTNPCPAPVVIGCTDQSELQIYENEQAQDEGTCQAENARAGVLGVSCDNPSLDEQISSCQAEIQDYQTEVQDQKQCIAGIEAEVQQQVQQQNELEQAEACALTPNSQWNSTSDACACNSGYAEQNGTCESITSICGSNSYEYDSNTNSCICNTGYEESGSGCVLIPTHQSASLVACQAEWGLNAVVQNGSCTCASGYELDGSQTQCVAVPVAPTIPPALNINNLPEGYSVAGATTSTSPSFAINQNLSVGASGSSVALLQQFLETKGLLTLPAGTTDGYFGNLTKQALIAFQKSAGLPATGFCGSMTRAAISAGQ